MNKTTYIIQWTTGDSDTCHGRKELMALLRELKYRIDGSNVMDGDLIAGHLKTVNN